MLSSELTCCRFDASSSSSWIGVEGLPSSSTSPPSASSRFSSITSVSAAVSVSLRSSDSTSDWRSSSWLPSDARRVDDGYLSETDSPEPILPGSSSRVADVSSSTNSCSIVATFTESGTRSSLAVSGEMFSVSPERFSLVSLACRLSSEGSWPAISTVFSSVASMMYSAIASSSFSSNEAVLIECLSAVSGAPVSPASAIFASVSDLSSFLAIFGWDVASSVSLSSALNKTWHALVSRICSWWLVHEQSSGVLPVKINVWLVFSQWRWLRRLATTRGHVPTTVMTTDCLPPRISSAHCHQSLLRVLRVRFHLDPPVAHPAAFPGQGQRWLPSVYQLFRTDLQSTRKKTMKLTLYLMLSYFHWID